MRIQSGSVSAIHTYKEKPSFSLRIEVLYNIFVASSITMRLGRLMKSVCK
jgi:hypothetical protein